MTQQEFVDGVKAELIDRGLSSYKDIYENPRALAEEITYYQSLTAEQKRIFFKIINQVQTDTVATFLSLLDGNFLLHGQTEAFALYSLDDPNVKLNVGLTDRFLESVNGR